ncbi:DUF1671-domain-containing protein [Schizopora paradoxa]|uniref:DUF1671-domain-containing protein n=1 Tax=Schizopora paradoxa TaxID=27342 RepID=A0A0H2RLW6_9AGAM|nr:DUF1671-domain-containing protein [Schizopora paradoxa]
MASLGVIVLDDSDSEDIQVITSSATDPVFCQICNISLTKQSLEARQAHYEQHFSEDQGEEPAFGEIQETTPSKQKESMNIIRRTRDDAFWHIDSNKPVPKNYSPGLLPVIRQALLKSHSKGLTTRAALCHEGAVHISTQMMDKLWGCGYRNFLMSCSALMAQNSQPTYAPQLMEDPEPGVRNLQRWIEAAWSAGFDKEGEADLKPLLGTTKWIGTVEISVAFSYRGIPTKLVDFAEVDKGAEIVTKWIVDYFDPVDSTSSKVASALSPEKKTIGDALRGASPVKMTDRMPLILQHKGHSRTIVGYEMMKNGTVNLLTFDPARSPPARIRQAGMSQLSSIQSSPTASSSKRKQFFERVLHPRGHQRASDSSSNSSIDRKGKKRQASPSSGPSSRSNDGNRLVKRVRGGLQSGDNVVAVGNAVEVIDVDDDFDDEVEIIEERSSNVKVTKGAMSSLSEALDSSEVLNSFRLRPKNVGKKDKYQILYFTMDDLLTQEEREDRKTVHSLPIKPDSSKSKRTFFSK